MIAAAQAASDPMLQLQGRNWRAVDLFEAGDLSEWRAETARHGALAAELRVPAYTWYTPLWAAVDALHAGRFDEAASSASRPGARARRAGDRNAELFAEMLGFEELAIMREDFSQLDLAWVEKRIATSATGIAYRSAYAWILAALGRKAEARTHLTAIAADGFAAMPFDANWLSGLAEAGEATLLLGDRAAAATFSPHSAPTPAARPRRAARS